MALTLPPPLAAYVAAINARDYEAALATFAEHARVKDEGRERRGAAEIRSWIDETVVKYDFRMEPVGVEADGAWTVVTARVTGTFPGSPAEIRFRFRVADGLITDLDIG